jgi:hypothetical protein
VRGQASGRARIGEPLAVREQVPNERERRACADRRPVVLASHMDDYTRGYIRDKGIAGDPISINGRTVSIREIKSRAGHGR